MPDSNGTVASLPVNWGATALSYDNISGVDASRATNMETVVAQLRQRAINARTNVVGGSDTISTYGDNAVGVYANRAVGYVSSLFTGTTSQRESALHVISQGESLLDALEAGEADVLNGNRDYDEWLRSAQNVASVFDNYTGDQWHNTTILGDIARDESQKAANAVGEIAGAAGRKLTPYLLAVFAVLLLVLFVKLL